MRTAYLIIGPIGSGKSAVADVLLSDSALATLEYIGSDIYKRTFFGKATDDRKRGYRCADELAFYRIEQLCKMGEDFAYEFCPTNANKIETIKYLLRKYSYSVVSVFVSTESKDINIARCKTREGSQADSVPVDKVKSRYDQALSRALEMIQLSTRIYFVDNSLETPRMIAAISDKAISVFDDSCGWFKTHVQQKLI